MKAPQVRRATPFLGIVTLLALVVAHGVQMGLVQAAALTETTPNLKAAFLGDLGLSGNAQAALQLVQAEGADIVLHQGDFGYNETDSLTPTNWDEQITSILGGNFPYFGSVGNHVVGQWTDYQQLLQARLDRIAGAAYTAGLPGSDVVTITSDDQAPTYIDNRAISEVTSSGDVTLGDFNSTFASDDVAQRLTEELYGVKKRSRLLQQWTFDVTGGSTVTFFVEAWHDSTAEDFRFEYSTDRSTWASMLTIMDNAGADAAQSHS